MDALDIPLNKLLLDPNNYRLQESEGFSLYPEDRFHLDRVQEATRRRLRSENLEPLKNSIISNGFLPIERIVVTAYPHLEDKYLVIEGNRRIASLLAIQDDLDAGVLIPESVIAVLSAVPCIVVNDDEEATFFREAIMGIRHVGGIKEWGGFQRAKLVADMRDNHGLDAASISDRIGLSVIEVNRRYRAYKALQQMQNDENYADYATPSLYPLFHEAVSIPSMREWLGWNTEVSAFENHETLESFYQLISPRQLDESGLRPPKIRTYSDVRALRDVLPNQEAMADLLQPERELVDALTIANRGKMANHWRNEVNEAKTALESIPALEVSAFENDDVALVQSLIDTAERLLAIRNALNK